MKQGSSISASVGAIVSSLATMGCCLPLGFAGALGAAGASAFLQRFRPWLLALSIVLLGIGFWQQRRARLCAGETELFERRAALDGRCARCGDDRFPTGNRWIYRRSSFKGREVKKKTFSIGFAVSYCLFWRRTCEWILPTPPGQDPLATLTIANFAARSKSPSTNPSKGPGWYSFFLRLSDLSAGGLRNRTTPATQFGSFAPGAGGVGADTSDGLAFTGS